MSFLRRSQQKDTTTRGGWRLMETTTSWWQRKIGDRKSSLSPTRQIISAVLRAVFGVGGRSCLSFSHPSLIAQY